jgi:hypothetical protein
MSGSGRTGARRRGRIIRVLRWQPKNEPQVWLTAIWSGGSGGVLFAIVAHMVSGHWWPVGGLTFAFVYTPVVGLGLRYRMRERQDARAARD